MNAKLIAIFFLLTISVNGQTFTERLRLVNEQYKVLQQLEIEMEIEVMDGAEKDVLYTEKMMLLRDHHRYYYKMGRLTMVMNDSSMILIEEANRQMLITRRDQVPEEMFRDPIITNLDSIMSFYENPVLISKSATQEHYRLKQKSGSVQQIEVTFNLSSQFLESVSYKTTDQQSTTIRFTKFMKPVTRNEQYFKNETYFHKTPSGLVAAAGFRGYQVSFVNQ